MTTRKDVEGIIHHLGDVNYHICTDSRGVAIFADDVVQALLTDIDMLREALQHYTQVVSSVNDPNDFTPKCKDEGTYAKAALAQTERWRKV